MIKDFLKRNVVIVAAVVFALVCVVYGMTIIHDKRDFAQRQEAEIARLTHDIAAIKRGEKVARTETVQKVSGLDLARKAKDDEAFKAFMSTVMTWDTMADYVKKRKIVMDRYGFKEGDSFVTTFMPGEKQGAWRTDASGKIHFAYPNANSHLADVQTSVTSIDGTDYHYFAIVRASTLSTDRVRGEAQNYHVIRYTIDGSGHIKNIKAQAGAAGLYRNL